MSLYNPSPFASAPVLLQPAVAEYLLGRRNTSTPDTIFRLTGVVDNGTTAVYSGTVADGNAPIVGALFSAQTENTTYNVVNAPITAVSIASNGQGTITVASVGAGSVAFGGSAIIPVPEIPETIVNNSFSAPAMLSLMGGSSVNRKLMAEVVFPTIPTAAQVWLQSAMRNVNNEYVDQAQVGTVAAGAVSLSQVYLDTDGMFYRFRVGGLTGTGTIIAKIVVGQ